MNLMSLTFFQSTFGVWVDLTPTPTYCMLDCCMALHSAPRPSREDAVPVILSAAVEGCGSIIGPGGPGLI